MACQQVSPYPPAATCRPGGVGTRTYADGMCGRYASTRSRGELLDEFEIERDATCDELPADYNVAPTKPVYAVLDRPRDREEPDAGFARGLHVVRWGLVPSWAKDTKIGARLINARVETVADKPAYRRAFAKRRCLLPADGYYEWYQGGAAPSGTGRSSRKPHKQPFFIGPADHGVVAFAGLYEIWRDRELSPDDPDAWLWSCTVITTSAPDGLGHIHDRMPMVVPPAARADWLDPACSSPQRLREALAPAMSGALTAYPVSTAVNNVRNNGPELLEPLPAEGGEPPGEQRTLL